MRSTFLFLTLLIFVSCTQDLTNIPTVEDVDPQLLEISKNPNSEAVFATIAVQMKAGPASFSKILALLNDLVRDSKKQLHFITKIWRGVNARCIVSKARLAGRQSFYESFLKHSKNALTRAQFRLGEVKDNIKGYTASFNAYKLVLTHTRGRHGWMLRKWQGKLKSLDVALDHMRSAIKAIENWSPKSAALIQTSLHHVKDAYVEVQEYDLPDISEFLETERTNDVKVRRRLLQWAKRILTTLLTAQLHIKGKLAKHLKNDDKIYAHFNGLINACDKGLKHLNKAVILTNGKIKNINTTIGLYAKLAQENSALVRANNAYCQNESVNFHKNQKMARDALKLFREIKGYFIKNYRKIHSYIKAKYHR